MAIALLVTINLDNSLSITESKLNKILFFGLGSAILLTVHSIFLGIKFDYDIYKLFRRVVMLLFIIFEIVSLKYFVGHQ